MDEPRQDNPEGGPGPGHPPGAVPSSDDRTQTDIPAFPASPGPGPIEPDPPLPAWSEEVSRHSSWAPPGPPDAPEPPRPPAPPPLDRSMTDFSAVSDVARPSGSTPSGSNQSPSGSAGSSTPSDDFAPVDFPPIALAKDLVLFHKYILRELLGRGGMGEVWRVHHIELDCERALKFIKPGLAQDPGLLRRFIREVKTMAKVEHEHKVAIYDARTKGGLAFMEMELVLGKSLSDLLKPGRPMMLDWVVRILQQLCDVLAVAHEAGIVHRDLKPANLMLLDRRPPGREFLKVLDFGIAKLLTNAEENEGGSLTNNAPIGTYPYMSPEQFGASAVDTRSDIYAVGVLLFEFLTGHRPFSVPKSNLFQWMEKHTRAPVPTFLERNPEVAVPPGVEDVVRRCLAKSPDDRPQSAQALFEEFEAASGVIRPPSRFGGSSSYSFLPPVPSTREPSSGSGSGSGFVASDPIGFPAGLDDGPTESHVAAKAAGPETRPVMAELSTLSGSYEWDVPETVPPPLVAPLDPPPVPPPVAAPGGGSGRFRRVLVRVAAGLLTLAALGTGLSLVVPGFRDRVVGPGPKPPAPRHRFEAVAGSAFEGGSNYRVFQSNLSGRKFPLPEGYRPAGPEPASDGWPRVIAREADRAEFVRVEGTTTKKKYRAGKPAWKEGDPDPDGRWCLERDDDPADREQSVSIEGFYLQRFEVTNRDFLGYYARNKDVEGFRDRLTSWASTYDPDQVRRQDDSDDILPAIYVDFETARAYARSVGGDLPGRYEWEFAASSRGDRDDFVWAPLSGLEVAEVGIGGKKWGVGKSKKDVTRQGIFDLGGNVREWVVDDARDGKAMACGGSFNDRTPFKRDDCGVKSIRPVQVLNNDVGFRVILRCPEATGP